MTGEIQEPKSGENLEAASLYDRVDLLAAEIEAVEDHNRAVNERLARGEVVTALIGGPVVRPLLDRAVELLRECQELLR